MKIKKLKQASLEAEYNAILKALEKTNNNRAEASRLLGIDRKTLYNKISKYKASLQEQKVA